MLSGKVFIFTGMLGICEDKDGLAAVLAHEISHVVAHHSGERISNSLLTTGLVLLSALLFDISGQITGRLFDFGFTLPNSRVQEVGLSTQCVFNCTNISASAGRG